MRVTYVLLCFLSLSSASRPFWHSLRVPYRKTAGTCNRSTPPVSWLTTRGHGILNWATAGIPPTGPNFCLGASNVTHTLEVDYHVNLTNAGSQLFEQSKRTSTVGDPVYDCGTGNPRIRYCVPFCSFNATLEKVVIDAAVVAHDPAVVAYIIFSRTGFPADIAITVIEVDLNADPEAHLVAEAFLDPSWCSVYIGIQTATVGYLYEIQVAKILT